VLDFMQPFGAGRRWGIAGQAWRNKARRQGTGRQGHRCSIEADRAGVESGRPLYSLPAAVFTATSTSVGHRRVTAMATICKN